MEEAIKKCGHGASFVPLAKRSAKLEHNPVTTSITLANFGVPAHSIRKIYRLSTLGYYSSAKPDC